MMHRSSIGEENPVIKLPQGLLEGFVMISRRQKDYYGFYGIPYAKKAERFELPQRWESWNGLRDGTRALDRYLQISKVTKRFIGSENCLFLNVFTPKFKLRDPDIVKGLPPMEPPDKFPVMVFLHGGGYAIGGGDLYGNKFLVDEDVILVTVNYRLGALGFLNTTDGLTGNLGLKDQVMALRWVQENIKYFGGDKDNVTLVGESAGAACAHFHMMSPRSEGLFAKVIMQSGNALCPWACNKEPLEKLKKLAKQIDLNGSVDASHMPEVISKLKRLDAEVLVAQRRDYETWKDDAPIIHFAPGIEIKHPTSTTFLSELPSTYLYNKGLSNDVPMIIGVNGQEGLYRAVPILKDPVKLKALNEHWSHVLPMHLMYSKDSVSRHDEFAISVRRFYFQNKPASSKSNDSRDNLTNMISDRLFNYPTRRTVLIHRQVRKTEENEIYLYYFNYKGDYSYMNGFEVSDTYGASHADELQYLMNQRIFYSKITPGSDADRMIDKMVELWTSFARRGKPSYSEQKKPWIPVESKRNEKDTTPLRYFCIDKKDEMIEEPFTERMEFWDNVPHISSVF